MVYFVEDTAFGPAPKGRDEQVLRSVAGEAVDDDFGGKVFKAADDKVGVLVLCEYVEGLLFVQGSKVCSAQDVEQLEFDALDV